MRDGPVVEAALQQACSKAGATTGASSGSEQATICSPLTEGEADHTLVVTAERRDCCSWKRNQGSEVEEAAEAEVGKQRCYYAKPKEVVDLCQ